MIDNSEYGQGEYSFEEITMLTERMVNLWRAGFDNNDFSELFDLLKEDRLNPSKIMIGTSLKYLRVREGVSIHIDSEIPVGSGLGSSASLSVAVPKAIAELFGMKVPVETINAIAYEIEKFMHGDGLAALVTFGKVVPLQHACDRMLGRDMDHVRRAHLAHPL